MDLEHSQQLNKIRNGKMKTIKLKNKITSLSNRDEPKPTYIVNAHKNVDCNHIVTGNWKTFHSISLASYICILSRHWIDLLKSTAFCVLDACTHYFTKKSVVYLQVCTGCTGCTQRGCACGLFLRFLHSLPRPLILVVIFFLSN